MHAAGSLVTHGATQAIMAAISGGIGGARVSINKNYLHELSTQALIAKMQSSRKTKLEFMRQAMTLAVLDYSLSRGLSDLAEYYNAGTIVGALQNIVSDAGIEKRKADDELIKKIRVKYDQGATRPIRERINSWLDSDLSKNISILKTWFQQQNPPITVSPSTWVDSSTTTEEMLRKAIKEIKIQE